MKSYQYSFEKLKAWIEAKELVKLIYKTTSNYPSEERFGITNQMRRSSVSVASNLAEGSSRKTSKDQAHFSTMAFSSLMELLNQIIISYELDFISEELYNELRKKSFSSF